MCIIGIILIILVIVLYALWLAMTMRQEGVQAKEQSGVQVFDVTVKGVYSPNVITAVASKPVRINFTRKEDNPCSKVVIFSDFHVKKELPENETVSVEITPEKAGTYAFTCDMGMYQGKLIVE